MGIGDNQPPALDFQGLGAFFFCPWHYIGIIGGCRLPLALPPPLGRHHSPGLSWGLPGRLHHAVHLLQGLGGLSGVQVAVGLECRFDVLMAEVLAHQQDMDVARGGDAGERPTGRKRQSRCLPRLLRFCAHCIRPCLKNLSPLGIPHLSNKA